MKLTPLAIIVKQNVSYVKFISIMMLQSYKATIYSSDQRYKLRVQKWLISFCWICFQGDSGGPAVSNDRLLGMVSFGYGCATPGSYGVYAKVAKVREWIEKITALKLN